MIIPATNPIASDNPDRAGATETVDPADFDAPDRSITVAGLLRVLGVTVILGSAATFMVQNWDTMSHILRYLSFLGFTGFLAFIGFGCGILLRDPRGARTLLALAAALVPVHCCQLGALLYSSVVPVTASKYPAFLYWHAPSLGSALTMLAIGLVGLFVVTRVSFETLARPSAAKLTWLYIAMNLVLVIPVREPFAAGLIALGCGIALASLDLYVFHRNLALRTTEGRCIRIMMAAPLVLLVGRTINLYAPDSFYLGTLFEMLAVFLFVFAPRYEATKSHASLFQYLSIVPATGGWLLVIQELIDTFDVAPSAWAPLVLLPLAGLFVVMGAFARKGGDNFWSVSAYLAVLTSFVQFGFHSTGAVLLTIPLSIAVLAFALSREKRLLFFIGVFEFIGGLVLEVHLNVHLGSLSPWILLGLIGTGTVILSSIAEGFDREKLRALLGKREHEEVRQVPVLGPQRGSDVLS